jgi:hypothetical protein
MDKTWNGFRVEFDRAQAVWRAGDAEPVKSLWSRAADVSIFGGQGGLEQGWDLVGPRLTWAAGRGQNRMGPTAYQAETLVEAVGSEFAYTVEIERALQGEKTLRELRVTQIYRLEPDGWRIIHRHADPNMTVE